jgi:predicted DNA-binding transcriptional regulator YafY
MSKKASNDTLLRQWSMLRLLPSRGAGITASELTTQLAGQGFEVDIRTVQRDLNKLSGPFPFVCNDKSVPQGWHWMPGAGLDIPGMSLPEALTLKMVEDYLAPLLPASLLEGLQAHLAHAERTLAALEDENPAARWADKVRVVQPTLATQAPRVDPVVLSTLQDALLREHQIEVAYQRFGAEEPSLLRLHPHAMVQRGPITYLVATAFDYDDLRLYAVHRMQSAVLQDDPAECLADFDVDAYIREGRLHFGSGDFVDLELWVDADLGTLLRETPLTEDMMLEADGEGFRVRATVADTWQLQWWLLSNAGQLVVRAPVTLRDWMVRRLERALVLQQSTDTPA